LLLLLFYFFGGGTAECSALPILRLIYLCLSCFLSHKQVRFCKSWQSVAYLSWLHDFLLQLVSFILDIHTCLPPATGVRNCHSAQLLYDSTAHRRLSSRLVSQHKFFRDTAHGYTTNWHLIILFGFLLQGTECYRALRLRPLNGGRAYERVIHVDSNWTIKIKSAEYK
jgi:hypothetical protein